MLKSRRNSKSSKEREVILIKPPEADWQPDERWELARRKHNAEKHFRTNNSYHPPRNRKNGAEQYSHRQDRTDRVQSFTKEERELHRGYNNYDHFESEFDKQARRNSKTRTSAQKKRQYIKPEGSVTKRHNKIAFQSTNYVKCVAKVKAHKREKAKFVSKTGKSFDRSPTWADWIEKPESPPDPAQRAFEKEWGSLDQEQEDQDQDEGNLLQDICGHITETFKRDDVFRKH